MGLADWCGWGIAPSHRIAGLIQNDPVNGVTPEPGFTLDIDPENPVVNRLTDDWGSMTFWS